MNNETREAINSLSHVLDKFLTDVRNPESFLVNIPQTGGRNRDACLNIQVCGIWL